MKDKPIFIQPAFLWDGKEHLSGKMEISPEVLIFHFDHFKESSLSLRIPLGDIQTMEVFKLYGLVSNGLKIMDASGRTNTFVMENPRTCKKEILKYLTHN